MKPLTMSLLEVKIKFVDDNCWFFDVRTVLFYSNTSSLDFY